MRTLSPRQRRGALAGAAMLASAALGSVVTTAVTAPSGDRDAIAKARADLGARIDALDGRVEAVERVVRPTTVPSATVPPTTLPPNPTTIPPIGRHCPIAPADGEEAITAAIAGCPNGSVVKFPAGAVYHQSHEIVVSNRTNLVIDGNGATFITSAVNTETLDPNWMLIDNTNVVLHNVVVEGNFKMEGPRSLERMQQQYPAGNHFNMGIGVWGGTNNVVRDSTIRDTFGDGIYSGPSGMLPQGPGHLHGIPHGHRFERLTISRTARMGAAFTGGTNMWFTDNRLSDSWYWGFDGEIDVPGTPLQDVHVLRNTFDGMYFGAITVPAPGGPGDVNRVEIRGNTATQAADSGGSSPVLINYWGSPEPVMQNIVVADNDFPTAYHGIIFKDVLSGEATGNTIRKTTGPGYNEPPLAEPVHLIRSPGVRVADTEAIGFTT